MASKSSDAKGLIFLPTKNMIIEETLRQKFAEAGGAEQIEPVELRLCDYDGSRYRIFVDAEAPNILYLSVWIRCFSELYAAGADDVINSEYANLCTSEPEENYDLTLSVDLQNPAEDVETLVAKFADLKRNLMAAPFERCFNAVAQSNASSLPPVVLHYREKENIYLLPREDRVTVIFSIHFDDPTDQVLARVFCQEFAEAKKTSGRTGVPCSFSKDPPGDLASMQSELIAESQGYLSFIFFDNYINTPERFRNSGDLIQGFRTYLLYHIKASKSYLHTRMRTRVSSLLDVLKQAKPKTAKVKKTAGGKTFKRR